MSVILRPESLQTPDEPARVTIHAALSVCEAIETLTGLSPKIKWVNDILLDRKKICGILTEGITDYESGGIGWLVVGIGINISAQTDDFPPELRERVTSLYPDGKAQLTRNQLAGEILSRLLMARDWDETLEGYKSRLMMLGETVTILRGEERFFALAEGVTPNGHLLVRRENGTVETLSSGEISIMLSP